MTMVDQRGDVATAVDASERADFERKLMQLLEQGNQFATKRDVTRAKRTCGAIWGMIAVAETSNFETQQLAVFKALITLLEANLGAYLAGNAVALESLRPAYETALRAAECVTDSMFVRRACRVYAAVLASYGAYNDARLYLNRVLDGLDRDAVTNEAMWVQAHLQVADMMKPEAALDVLGVILKRPKDDLLIDFEYVNAMTLQARTLWHLGRKRESRYWGWRAAYEARRIDPKQKRPDMRRAQLLLKWFGVRRYEKALSRIRCPHI
jgi:hypothetical protein